MVSWCHCPWGIGDGTGTVCAGQAGFVSCTAAGAAAFVSPSVSYFSSEVSGSGNSRNQTEDVPSEGVAGISVSSQIEGGLPPV